MTWSKGDYPVNNAEEAPFVILYLHLGVPCCFGGLRDFSMDPAIGYIDARFHVAEVYIGKAAQTHCLTHV